MVCLQETTWLEAHEGDPYLVEFLDWLHVFTCYWYFLTTNWEIGSNFLSVKDFTGLLTDKPLRTSKLLIVECINFLLVRSLWRHYRTEEGECDLRAWAYAEHALPLRAFAEFFLPDSFHEIIDSRLSTFDAKHFRELLFLVEWNYVCVELFDVELWNSTFTI